MVAILLNTSSMYFRVWDFTHKYSTLPKVSPRGDKQQTSFDSDSGFASGWRRTIIWTNIGLISHYKYALLGLNDFNTKGCIESTPYRQSLPRGCLLSPVPCVHRVFDKCPQTYVHSFDRFLKGVLVMPSELCVPNTECISFANQCT